MKLKEQLSTLADNIKTYWRRPPEGKYMPFKEVTAYSVGGIGAYFIITLGTACLLATGNTLISSTLGVNPTDMYVLYVIAVLANIPLTGIRANIIDNTRNKAGKYRPYIVSMGIPTTIICVLMVWFPYDKFGALFGEGMLFGVTRAYFVKCTLILIFNLLLHFFYYFFYDSYENLIHVLSPNSQERADVAAIKSVVYSLAPTIVNLITPIIAQNVFHTNSTDIRVYRLLYPIIGIGGILLCILVYKNTQEKIVQARTHVIQIKFSDALREVAGNKYFWIISFAGWIGFLEASYANVLYWLYNYGGVCSGNVYGLVVTIYGNASLWGMILAPMCIRKWGKKFVLVVTNIMNIIFILMMLPFTSQMNGSTIWAIMGCLYLNAFMGSFALILNPAIQADIRDYQQYKSGERIDGMFSAVATIGTVIALLTSAVLPVVYKRGGITTDNALAVTSNPDILGRMLGDGKTVGEILSEQMANGQNNYSNAYSALYDPNILENLLKVLILFSALGALLNVVPYFWYDFNERKQKSVVKVLKVRAMFEDYNNGAIEDKELVEAVDIIRESRALAAEKPVDVSKKWYKGISDKAEKKAQKKAYKAAVQKNEDIEIAKFVCEELDKFSSNLVKYQLKTYKKVYDGGLEGLRKITLDDINKELAEAKALPKTDSEEKQIRKFAISVAKKKKSAYKAIQKYYGDPSVKFERLDFAVLEKYFDQEDACDDRLKTLYTELSDAKKAGNSEKVQMLRADIKKTANERKQARDMSKKEMDRHAYFNRAAKPYLDAERLINQEKYYQHFGEIEALYDEAKEREAEAKKARDAEIERLKADDAAYKAQKKAEKLAKKGKK